MLAQSCAREPTQSWAFMPILRSLFHAPAAPTDNKAIQLLLTYWHPTSPHSLADTLRVASEVVAQLLPIERRAQIAARLAQHIDGDVQELLLGELSALSPSRQYEDWVRPTHEAMAAAPALVASLRQLVSAITVAIWRLRVGHGVTS